jgi:hypothetical protein
MLHAFPVLLRKNLSEIVLRLILLLLLYGLRGLLRRSLGSLEFVYFRDDGCSESLEWNRHERDRLTCSFSGHDMKLSDKLVD